MIEKNEEIEKFKNDPIKHKEAVKLVSDRDELDGIKNWYERNIFGGEQLINKYNCGPNIDDLKIEIQKDKKEIKDLDTKINDINNQLKNL